MARRTRIQGWRLAAASIGLALAAPAVAGAAFEGPDGPILFTGRAPGAAVADVWSVQPGAGTPAVDLTDAPGGPGEGHDPAAAADGRIALTVGSGNASEIWTMNADGTGADRLTTNSFEDRMPAFSPDGSRIAFVTDRGEPSGTDVWTMAADGSDQRRLLRGPGADLSPQYSSDGAFVLVATDASGDFDIAHVPVAGAPHASATSITFRSALDETEPAIQPDMVRVAYTRTDPLALGPGDVLTAYSSDGTDEFPLAIGSANQHSPSFSPDANEVVYVSGAGLITAVAGGSAPAPLAVTPALDPADPEWAVGETIDTFPPQTTITKRPHRRDARRHPQVRFSATEPGSRFACSLDGRRFRRCRSPLRLRGLDIGRHRFRVRATDAAGNVDPSPAKAKFRRVRGGGGRS